MKVEKVKISEIEDYYNPARANGTDDVSDLIDSIDHRGLLQPIGVAYENKKPVCVFGHRRLQACKKLDWDTIDCVILPNKDMTEVDYLIINATENLKRKDPTVFDLGNIFEHLIEKGLTIPEVVAKLGLTKKTVEDCLHNYKEIPEEYKNKVVLKEKGKYRNDKSVIGLATAVQVGHVQRRFGLSKQETKNIFDVVSKAGYNLRQAELLAALLNNGVTLADAKRKIELYETKTLDFIVRKEELQKYIKEYKTFSKLVESLIKQFDPKLIISSKKTDVV